MSDRHFILATAGHVDHGKSSLVHALTGIDPDRLPEEKARGITIDLGFAHLTLDAPASSGRATEPIHLGIVDVPGHEDFVKNMVAGVGAIDLALFVVAADDGWMPQSEEHLQILTYLGVTRAVVALTKADLVNDVGAATAAVREQLKGSPFAGAPIVPTSAPDGTGIDELKAALARALADAPAPRDVGKPRLSVDRVFALRGIGTVVTGTLTGGSFARGQEVVIQPRGTRAKIRSVQIHNREVPGSGPGTRTALNLPEIDHASGVARGDTVTIRELGDPGRVVDVVIERTARGDARGATAMGLPRNGARVRVHQGSGNWPVRVRFLGGEPLQGGRRILAQLRFEKPVFFFGGDRFIVRDWPGQRTLAGGMVLDAAAGERGLRSELRREFLEARAASPGDAAVWLRTEIRRARVARRAGLLARTNFSATEIADVLARLAAEGAVVLAGEIAADAEAWRELASRAAAMVDEVHAKHPEQAGMALTELRAALIRDLPFAGAFDALVGFLCANGFARTGAHLKRASHRPSLPAQLRVEGERIRAALAAKPFDPPPRRELAPGPNAQQALRFLRESGAVVELNDDVVLLTEQFLRARALIVRRLREGGPASASDLRQLLQTTRRVMIPLLERLDREGVTVRRGDERVLRSG